MINKTRVQKSPNLKRNYPQRLVMTVALVFLGLFFYIPLLLILTETLGGGGLSSSGVSEPPGDLFSRIWGNPYYWKIIRFTFFQALVSTVFSLFLGIPGAYLLGRYSFPGKKIVKSLTTLPFVLPSILVVLGFVLFFGNNGVINRFLISILGSDDPPLRILYSFKAIILAHGFYNFPIIMRIVGSAWEGLPENQYQAARSLGASRFYRFRTVTLPNLTPAILSASSLVFLFCFMSFAIILVLGGGPKYSTLEVEVYRLAKFTLDFPAANLLGLTGAVLSLGILAVNLTLQKRASKLLLKTGATLKPRKLSFKGSLSSKVGMIIFIIYLILVAVLLLGPLFSVAANSLQKKSSWGGSTEWTLKWYKQLFNPPPGTAARGVSLKAVTNSLSYALGTVLLALPLGTLLAVWTGREKKNSKFGRLGELFLMLPMGISPVILGLGYLKFMAILPERVPLGAWAIIGAHTIITYPFVMRSVSAALHRVTPSLKNAAASLGAPPRMVFRSVELPLLKGGIFAGAAFAFALSLGEINATILLSGPGQITIPLAIYRLIGSYNFFGACVLGTLLMVLSGAAFFIIDRFEETDL